MKVFVRFARNYCTEDRTRQVGAMTFSSRSRQSRICEIFMCIACNSRTTSLPQHSALQNDDTT